jgi:hypothetical protein
VMSGNPISSQTTDICLLMLTALHSGKTRPLPSLFARNSFNNSYAVSLRGTSRHFWRLPSTVISRSSDCFARFGKSLAGDKASEERNDCNGSGHQNAHGDERIRVHLLTSLKSARCLLARVSQLRIESNIAYSLHEVEMGQIESPCTLAIRSGWLQGEQGLESAWDAFPSPFVF